MEYVKLKDICFFLPKSKIKAGEGMDNGKYIFFTSSDTKVSKINEYLYDDEAVIIGTGGKPSCNYCKGKFSVSTDNFVLKSNTINIKYLYYFLRNNNLSILEKGFHGAGLKHISKDYVSDINVPLLDYSKQCKIVSTLDSIYININFYKDQLKNFDNIVKSQFIEMFSSYEKVKLCDLAEIIMGQSPNSKTYNDYSEGVPFFQGKADFGDKYTIVRHWTNKPIKIARKNSVLLSVRAPVGPVNLANEDCCIGRGLCSINALEKKTNNEFLYNALKIIEKELSLMGSGSTFKAINKNDVQNLIIPDAPYNKQIEYVNFISQIDKSKYFGGDGYGIC